MYQRITDDDPYIVPMRIYPAVHYTMGGLWVDYNLMTTVPGLFALGEANFSDHGANRLGASALMQGLADGYFVIPYTIGGFFAENTPDGLDESHPAFEEAIKESKSVFEKLLEVKGSTPVDNFHRELGKIMWEYVGMGRDEEGLKKAIEEIPKLRKKFWSDVKIPGEGNQINVELEKPQESLTFRTW